MSLWVFFHWITYFTIQCNFYDFLLDQSYCVYACTTCCSIMAKDRNIEHFVGKITAEIVQPSPDIMPILSEYNAKKKSKKVFVQMWRWKALQHSNEVAFRQISTDWWTHKETITSHNQRQHRLLSMDKQWASEWQKERFSMETLEWSQSFCCSICSVSKCSSVRCSICPFHWIGCSVCDFFTPFDQFDFIWTIRRCSSSFSPSSSVSLFSLIKTMNLNLWQMAREGRNTIGTLRNVI